MIDYRRLNTGDVLAAGVLEIDAPMSAAPDTGIEYVSVNDEEHASSDNRRAALAAGKGLDGCMYYGVWRIWPDGNGYSGELMQYRAVTDHFSKLSLDDAVEKSDEWFGTCYG